jgi:hypothetical protein
MQHEVTRKQPLLDKHGHIIEEGWARRPLWQYDRSAIKASALRIKEWDYYAIISHEKHLACCLTFSDLGYVGLFAIAIVDLTTGDVRQCDSLKIAPWGKLGLPATSGDYAVSWSNRTLRIALSRKGEHRRLLFGAPDLLLPDGERGVDGDITLAQPDTLESLNIATSWEKKRSAFYLNEKINCLAASGTLHLGKKTVTLHPHEAFGVLDWGRGRWTYTNRWYWASASGIVNDHLFGFNLGYGFSDRSVASENAILYDRKIHKLDEVSFEIPPDACHQSWHITSNDGRCELTFTPKADRQSHMNYLLIKSVQMQVFGYYHGTVVLDDGTMITIHDFPGFAEDVYNRY